MAQQSRCDSARLFKLERVCAQNVRVFAYVDKLFKLGENNNPGIRKVKVDETYPLFVLFMVVSPPQTQVCKTRKKN